MVTLVLGAGVAGLSTAFFLQEAGEDVTVIDAAAGPAGGASGGNAGLLVPSQSAPLNGPGVHREVLAALFRRDGPVVIDPRMGPSDWRWVAGFLRNAAPERHRAHTGLVLSLARYSRRVLEALAADAGIPEAAVRPGVLLLARGAAGERRVAGTAKALARLGLAATRLSREAVLAREPALAPVGGEIAAGLLTPEDGSGDCEGFCRALAGRLAAGGARLRFGERVRRIEVAGGRVAAVATEAQTLAADRVVVALGAASPALLAPLGLRLPVRPVHGLSFTIPGNAWPRPPHLPVRDADARIVVTPFGDRVRVTGMAVIGRAAAVKPAHADRVRAALLSLFPEAPLAAAGPVRVAARPVSRRGPPILGPTPVAGLHLAVGHGPLGWTLGPGSGRIVADLAFGRPPAIDVAGLFYGSA